MSCVDWKDIKSQFRVDQLIDLYVRLSSDAIVYESPVGKRVWKGWTLRKGQIAGKVYSWIDDKSAIPGTPPLKVDGLYLMFDGNEFTNGKPYYIKMTKKLIDWEFVKQQLDSNRKAKMNYYDRFFDDLEQKLCEAERTVQKVLTYTLIGAGVYLLWDNYLKYEFFAYRANKIFNPKTKR